MLTLLVNHLTAKPEWLTTPGGPALAGHCGALLAADLSGREPVGKSHAAHPVNPHQRLRSTPFCAKHARTVLLHQPTACSGALANSFVASTRYATIRFLGFSQN
ncbi:MAG: hypothetical protein AMJ93_01885 [Anaerolineae bacterium SM23_84]|nr:MAG: hypothetical protein AMJ93_01885 [Anaerolineae bacterium SM23_84]